MKKLLLSTLLAFAALGINAQIKESATDAVKNMGVGWNLGNTLDASSSTASSPTMAAYWGGQGIDSENYWGQPKTKPELFKMMKKAGYGAIRVPVTWYNHMDANGNVKADWMKRVHEVVDYVIDAGLYCIVNVHHDTGADSGSHQSWLKADEYSKNKERFEKLWKQIAEEFKGYGDHLLFESYNEMLDTKSSWCFASFNASGSYDATLAKNAYDGINGYAQSFVDVVRATGGNNATRNLVVNTYGACNGGGNWNSHLQDPLKEMKLPEDKEKGHLIFEIHTYPQIATKNNQGVVTNRKIADIRKEIDDNIAQLKTHLVSKGAPVIIGEWGTSNVDAGAGKTDYDVRRDLMLQFVDYFVKQTKAAGMAAFYWMGITDGTSRSIPVFSQADLAECMVKAYHGADFNGEYPEMEAQSEYVVFEGEKAITSWAVNVSVPADAFKSLGEGMLLEIVYKQEGGGDDIQFFYGDWSSKPSFKVDGKSYNGDFNPGKVLGTPNGTEHTTIFTFDATAYKALCSKGLIVFGDGWRMYKLRLVNPTTGINSVNAQAQDDVYYNLAGQRVDRPTRGIYIKGGKKVIIRN